MRTPWQKYFWLAVYFLSPLIPISIILRVRAAEANDPVYVVSMVLGVCAYIWLVNQIMLSARPRFLERYFGMDRIYRFHSLMAVVSITLAIMHFIFKRFVIGITVISGLIALALFVFGAIFSLLFLEDSFLLRLHWVLRFRNWVRKSNHPSRAMIVLFHNQMVIALTVLVIHILTTSGSLFNSTFLKIFYPSYFGIGILFYVFHKFIHPGLLRRNAHLVSDVVAEAPGITSLHIQSQNDKRLVYTPGQFIFLTLIQEGLEKEAHPFSLSSTPEREDAISVTIKAVGDFTQKVAQVKPGAIALVEGPYGVFSHNRLRSANKLVFLAGGIGITPLLSMLRTLRVLEPEREVLLIWAARLRQDLFAANELDSMTSVMSNFHWEGVLSDEIDWNGDKGLLDGNRLERLLGKPDVDRPVDIFLCGPPRMMDFCLDGLKKLGYRRNQIHFERFAL